MGGQSPHSQSHVAVDKHRIAGFARIFAPGSKTRYRRPATYGSSLEPPRDSLLAPLNVEEISEPPAQFERQIVHSGSAESHIQPSENNLREHPIDGNLSELLSRDYEATYTLLYQESRRRVAQRSYHPNNVTVPARPRRETATIERRRVSNGLGALADFHRNGQLVVIDFLDSTVLTGALASGLREEPGAADSWHAAIETEDLNPPSTSTSITPRPSFDTRNSPHTETNLCVAKESKPVPPEIPHDCNSPIDLSSSFPPAMENAVSPFQTNHTIEATPQVPNTEHIPPSQTNPESNCPSVAEAGELAELVQPYLWYAKCKCKLGNRRKRRMWARVCELLEISDFSLVLDEMYLSVTHLLRLVKQKDGDPFEIVDYLKSLAIRWNFKAMADTFLERYTHSNGFLKFRENVWKKYPKRILIPVERLASGNYTVSSFFSAVHVVATTAMPANRCIPEYIAISILLGKLIARLFEHMSTRNEHTIAFRRFPIPLISTSISILVCIICSPTGWSSFPLSRASLGFSLTGAKKRRAKLIDERKLNLPSLQSIEAQKGITWDPGNCAEPEILAHMNAMYQDLEKEVGEQDVAHLGKGPWKRLSVCLTLKLEEKKDEYTNSMKGKPLCQYCKELADKVSSDLGCEFLDMAFFDEDSS